MPSFVRSSSRNPLLSSSSPPNRKLWRANPSSNSSLLVKTDLDDTFIDDIFTDTELHLLPVAESFHYKLNCSPGHSSHRSTFPDISVSISSKESTPLNKPKLHFNSFVPIMSSTHGQDVLSSWQALSSLLKSHRRTLIQGNSLDISTLVAVSR